MKAFALLLASVVAAVPLGAPPCASQELPRQDTMQLPPLRPRGHSHARGTLLIARLRPVTGQAGASGTGAFALEARGRTVTLRYDLTYDGVPGGAASIALRNSGEGGTGEVVHTICGALVGGRAPACPGGPGATLSGTWTAGLTPALVHEIIARRVYVELRGGQLLRGQLFQQPFMATHVDFVARFGGANQARGATGTGAFHLIHFGNGTEELHFEITVTGAGQVSGAELVTADSARIPLAQRRGLSLLATAEEPQRVGNTLSGRISSRSPSTTLFRIRAPDLRAQLLRGEGTLRITTTGPGARPLTARIVPIP